MFQIYELSAPDIQADVAESDSSSTLASPFPRERFVRSAVLPFLLLAPPSTVQCRAPLQHGEASPPIHGVIGHNIFAGTCPTNLQ